MSEPLGRHEPLFDLEPTETAANTDDAAGAAIEPVNTDFDDQGAFDIGMAVPERFRDPEADDVVETSATGPRKHPNKVSFYQDPEDTARLRGAVLHTMIAEGHRSLSQFITRAVMKEVQRLEEKYNDGELFPAVSANEMPQGRPHQ